ncbi:hypothetical protein FIC94_04030 [Ochrobactrum teleogrylli]|uniref:Uncharacterized protein n=1 Tax=Ochrobactrum teleogrylli TaxID=2479765 RepID=A0ABY2YB54_9HYPH|nr:hypothetical protein FIC94_04030 [[Ochrobactrum] teleogrylli]
MSRLVVVWPKLASTASWRFLTFAQSSSETILRSGTSLTTHSLLSFIRGSRFTAHIKRAADDVKRALENEPQTMAVVEQVRIANFGNLFDELGDSDAESFLYALSTVEAFSEVFNVTFYAMA